MNEASIGTPGADGQSITGQSISAESITREALAPLLLRRFRLITPPILLGTAAFAVLHVLFGERHLTLLLAMKLAQAIGLAGGLWMSMRHPTRTVITRALLMAGIPLIAVTAITGIMIGNVQTNSLIFAVIALASSSFLPWGVRCQTALVVTASVAAAAPLLSNFSGYHDSSYDLVALAVAYAISIYIAREVEEDTLAGYRAEAAAHELAESRADFEGLFRSSNVLLGMLELTANDFRYVDVNETLASIFSTTVEKMTGKTGRELGFAEESIQRWRESLQQCAAEGSMQIPELRLVHVKPERWYHLSFTAIRDSSGEVVRFSGIGADITDLKVAEENVRHLNTDLENQVRERTALLGAANKDLESFAYSVSHDLRTPLRTIEGFAALLTEDRESRLSPESVGLLDRIRSASQHMARLIDDILRLSRAGRSGVHRTSVDLSALASEIAAELATAEPNRTVHVHVAPGLKVNADPNLLKVVMSNLMNNAWKYSRRRERAEIHVGSEMQDGEQAYYVRDNGCGFDMRFVGKLFQPFERLHTAEEYEGTGVGLATVARVVRRHGGKVWAAGGVNAGASVYFTLRESVAADAVPGFPCDAS